MCDSNWLRSAYVGGDVAFTWTYSVFEEFLNESITPSMYKWMADYVESSIDWTTFQPLGYRPGPLESDAVDAYFEVPIIERINMHERMMRNLTTRLRYEAHDHKAVDYINTLLHEESNWYGGHE